MLAPPGIDADYLIETAYVAAHGWGVYGIDDRLTFRQLEVLLTSPSGRSLNVYGLFGNGLGRKSLPIESSPASVGQFFAEMAGGDIAVFDFPNSFLISVLEGDITLVASNVRSLQRMFGASAMTRADWIDLANPLRADVSKKILNKYVQEPEA